jgi:hypothetical protein
LVSPFAAVNLPAGTNLVVDLFPQKKFRREILPIVKENRIPGRVFLGIEINGGEAEIADGGFVDWTQQLLENGKERMLISGFGLELLYKLRQG